jgi:DNA-binding NarL/FixJ family response regulator
MRWLPACIVSGKADEEAIDAAKTSRPDLIVLDLSMPVMNGLQSGTGTSKIISANSNNSLFLIRAEPVANGGIAGRDKPGS